MGLYSSHVVLHTVWTVKFVTLETRQENLQQVSRSKGGNQSDFKKLETCRWVLTIGWFPAFDLRNQLDGPYGICFLPKYLGPFAFYQNIAFYRKMGCHLLFWRHLLLKCKKGGHLYKKMGGYLLFTESGGAICFLQKNGGHLLSNNKNGGPFAFYKNWMAFQKSLLRKNQNKISVAIIILSIMMNIFLKCNFCGNRVSRKCFSIGLFHLPRTTPFLNIVIKNSLFSISYLSGLSLLHAALFK